MDKRSTAPGHESFDDALVDVRVDDAGSSADPSSVEQSDFDRAIVSAFAMLCEEQEPLGAEFAAVWDDNADRLYQSCYKASSAHGSRPLVAGYRTKRDPR